MSCPGSKFSVIRPPNTMITTEWPDGYYTNISLDTQNLWSSGLHGLQGSVSSMFNIQWRSYDIRQQNLSSLYDSVNSTSTRDFYDNGSPYIIGG